MCMCILITMRADVYISKANEAKWAELVKLKQFSGFVNDCLAGGTGYADVSTPVQAAIPAAPAVEVSQSGQYYIFDPGITPEGSKYCSHGKAWRECTECRI